MNSQYINSKISDFVAIREHGYPYVDKTMFIPQIEHGADYAFYVRPHGFGATTLISMLMAYYDINMKDKWQQLFGDLYIGSCPTPGRSSYLVGCADFRYLSGDLTKLQEELYKVYYAELDRVLDAYSYIFTEKVVAQLKEEGAKVSSPTDYLALICREAQHLGYRFFLFVDGFDTVADCILAQGGKIDYTDGVQVSNMRTYFKFFDSINMASHLSIARIFAVGTIPIAITKFFAGFDRGMFYTIESDFAMLSGFSVSDVKHLLEMCPRRSSFKHSIDDLVSIMSERFGGYCFSPHSVNNEKLLNCKETIEFIEEYITSNFLIPTSHSHCNMCRILKIRDHQYDVRTSALRDTFGQAPSIISIEKIIPIDRLYDTRYFLSMMYYCGTYTIVGEKWGGLLLGLSNADAQDHINAYMSKA